jgi:hypothetical protein
MSARTTKRAAAKRAVGEALAEEIAQEMVLAEERGAARVREQVRAAVAEHRRVVRVGEQQVEVVETAALSDVVDE